MDHTITHFEIPAPDMKKAVAFYSAVFGWQIELMPGEQYAMFRTSENSGGGLDASTQPAPQGSGPGLVINVEDINAKLADIQNAGGTMVQERTEIPGGYGFYARFTDTNGNHLQIYSKN